MKKILLMLIMSVFVFAGCSSDEDEGCVKKSDVVGTWVTTETFLGDREWVDLDSESYFEDMKCYATFRDDKTYKGWGRMGNGSGTWELKDGVISTYVDGWLFLTYSDIVFNGNDRKYIEFKITDNKGKYMKFRAKKQ